MRNTVTKIRLLSSSFVLALALITSQSLAPATAATNGQTSGIKISPTQKEITLGSGLLVANTTVSLTNNTAANVTGTIRLVDFKTLNETGGLLFSEAGVSLEKYGLANWMTLPNGTTINVPSGATTDIPVHIDNRADLAPGGHYGAVVITLGTPSVSSNNKAALKQELVSLLLVKKVGGEKYGLDLTSFTADTHSAVPASATTRFQNTGNVHVVPRGYITVTDSAGVVVKKGTLNPDSSPVLPGTNRQLVTQLQTVGKSSRGGDFKVTAYYRYDEKKDFASQTIAVRGARQLPILPIVTVALTAICVLLGWRLRRRSVRKRYKRR